MWLWPSAAVTPLARTAQLQLQQSLHHAVDPRPVCILNVTVSLQLAQHCHNFQKLMSLLIKLCHIITADGPRALYDFAVAGTSQSQLGNRQCLIQGSN